MNSKAVACVVLLSALAGCSSPENTPPPPKPQAEHPQTDQPLRPEYQPGAEALRQKVIDYLKSDKEPSIKDAHWLNATHLIVAMINNGGSYDGWAESVCAMAGSQGLVTHGTRIEIIDFQSMLNEKFKSLGSHYCQLDGYPATEVKFNGDK